MMMRSLPAAALLVLLALSSAAALDWTPSAELIKSFLESAQNGMALEQLIVDAVEEAFPESKSILSSPAAKARIALAAEAFLFSYVLVNTAPNMVSNGVTSKADMSQILWQRVPNNASYNSIVTPNVNVLYGPAFLDLSKGPITIEVPDTAGRYYVLQCMDFWGFTFDRVGFSTTGTGAGTFTMVGPSYKGNVTADMLVSDTEGVWMMGRIAVINQNATDIAIADSLLDGFVIKAPTELETASPVFTTATAANKLWQKFIKAPKVQVRSYWAAYTTMVQYNPTLPSMDANLANFALIGVTKKGVNWNALTKNQRQALEWATPVAWKLLQVASEHDASTKNNTVQLITSTGWTTSPQIGNVDASLATLAIVSYAYVAANPPDEAVYWDGRHDTCGDVIVPAKYYTFNITSRPPYNAFWSLTTYNASNFFLIPTTDNVYTLGSQFPNLMLNADGGAVLYLSRLPPSDPSLLGNWLPLGEPDTSDNDVVYFIFRIYSPSNPDVVYTYAPPVLQLTDASFAPIACSPAPAAGPSARRMLVA